MSALIALFTIVAVLYIASLVTVVIVSMNEYNKDFSEDRHRSKGDKPTKVQSSKNTR